MWFRYRKIKALYLEGNVTEAAAALPDILQGTVANWVIYALASAIMQQQDDKEKTLLYAGYCALFDTSYEKRVKVYRRLVPVLYDMGEVRLAMLHRQFTDILYKENNWSIRSWKLDWEVSQEIMTMPKKDILRELTSAWRTWRNQNKVFFKGIVKCILPSGRDGFITGEGNQDYYFKMRDIEFGRSHLQSGSHVRFTTCKRLNKKKQREEENATEISVES